MMPPQQMMQPGMQYPQQQMQQPGMYSNNTAVSNTTIIMQQAPQQDYSGMEMERTVNLINIQMYERNMRYLFCCDIPQAYCCWYIGSIFEIVGIVWVLLYFFLSMGNPYIAIFSTDFNVNAISYYNMEKADGNGDIVKGFATWVWITLVILLGLLVMRIMQTRCFFHAQRDSHPSEELADRYMGLQGVKWALASEILTLVSGIIGIQAWKAQRQKIEAANGNGFDSLFDLFTADAAAVASRQMNRLISDQIWIYVMLGWAYYSFKRYADHGATYLGK